jgi:lipopolysaccharide transport system ATP-binding protein
MSSEAAVHVDSLSKAYLLWDNPRDRLRQPVNNRLSKWFHVKEKRYYHEFWALRDISVDVRPGETLGVIGRNGCGKSTLLQLLAGTVRPTSGECSVSGRVSALLELGSGFNPEFTGRENVYMNAAILGLTTVDIDERYGRIVEFADIGEYIDQPVKLYSSGMFMRLAFSVAIHVDPDVLLVDEALSVGDAFFVQKCMRFMKKFREEHCLLFVSHDTGAVRALCDRALLLNHGEMKALGPASEVCEAYLEESFGANQDVETARSVSTRDMAVVVEGEEVDFDPLDQRAKFLNESPLRNDIRVVTLAEPASDFGAGGSRVTGVSLRDPGSSAPLAWVVGGELVVLQVDAVADRDLSRVILGWSAKDRLGQVVFSDNTYLTYAQRGYDVPAGAAFRARFTFRMPLLPAGDYVVAASVAEGTQLDHVQLHWVHDALHFRSETTSVSTGLVGIPQREIVMQIVERRGEVT